MITSDKTGVQLIVQQCLHHRMNHVVCSPGSRNAPFMIAFDEHPDITCYVVHDERSAAFFALGMSQQLGKPVGLVCTSGSAPLNYYPAVAEAYYQCVPLVVITADRPVEWVDQGDGQTIVQKDVFGAHVRYSVQLNGTLHSSDQEWYARRELSVAFAEGNGDWKGPIHINVALEEPLYGLTEMAEPRVSQIRRISGDFKLSSKEKDVLLNALKYPKKMVICAQMDVDSVLLDQLRIFADDSSVAVLVENTSNLTDLRFIHCIDRTLNAITEEQLEEFAPDLLITIGGAVISKRIKSYIRKYKPEQHWKIGHDFPYMDTYMSLTHSVSATPYEFFRELNALDYRRSVSNYGARWKQKDFLVQEKMKGYLNGVPFSDLKVFETVLDFIPDDSVLHMANSSVVRYCQLFDPVRTVQYYSNRGTSGIDGSTSTAAGAALVRKDRLNVLITGDVSFFYDSNALWNHYLGENFRIILVNNAGGGIFRIIPGPSSTKQLEAYFEATHDHQARDLCKAFDITYFSCASVDDLESVMADFYSYEENGRPKLLEVFTPRELNAPVLDDFFKAMR